MRAAPPLSREHGLLWRTLLLTTTLVGAVACRDADEPGKRLSARTVASDADLIGGPLAHGQVGDFIIENESVRFIISGAHHSWGPGLFGGTVVDADLQRTDPEFSGLRGNDHFAELFPTVNLLVGNPTDTEVRVLSDGSDGKAAQVVAEGGGLFYLDGLSLLDPERSDFSFILKGLDLKTALRFKTIYTLRPNTRVLEIETEVIRPESSIIADTVCTGSLDGCGLTCDAYRRNPNTGCFTCECDEGAELELLTESVPLLARILGDTMSSTGAPKALEAGLIGGDFLFFGGSTDVFAPGFGFDVKGPIFDNFFRGVDTITNPLTFDWVAARGKNVSYAMYTKRDTRPTQCLHRVVLTRILEGGDEAALSATLAATGVAESRLKIGLAGLSQQKIPFSVEFGVAPGDLDARVAAVQTLVGDKIRVGTEFDGDCRQEKVLVPLFTSSATMLAGSGSSCLLDDADDATCDSGGRFNFKRYLVVGDGDISSVTAPIFEAKGIATGSVRGVVFDTTLGRQEASADIFVLRDPDSTKTFETYDALTRANLEQFGSFGIENHAKADVGTDPQKSGRYAVTLPVGTWLLVARTAQGVVSKPERVEIKAGTEEVLHLQVVAPGGVDYRVVDGAGNLVPSKLTFQALGDDGEPLYADGKRRPEFGDGRFDDGIFTIIYSPSGKGTQKLEPGEYLVTASRGIEYAISQKRLRIEPGQVSSFNASLPREVDTSGYISGDFHLHAEPSMDAGMDLGLRVITNVAEGVELLSSSDHDSITDYRPKLLEHGLDRFATTQVGLEVSTLEMGHTLAFPLGYNFTNLPVHGAIDWVCQQYDPIFRAARALGEFGPDSTVLTVAHPRDGFLGYFDQFRLDPWTLERGPGGLESNNPLFRTLSCDFDSIEVFNGKRWELIHTPTQSEINDVNRCWDEINAASTNDAIMGVCTWLRKPTVCAGDATEHQGNPCSWWDSFEVDLKVCKDSDTTSQCKDKVRNALTRLTIRRLLRRTEAEQLAWRDASPEARDADKAKCSPAFLKTLSACPANKQAADEKAGKPVLTAVEYAAACAVENGWLASDNPLEDAFDAPCAQHQGVAEDWFQLLNFGLNVTAMGNSDSHGTTLEPGLPRNYIASSTDDASQIDKQEIAKNIKAMNVVPTTGPFVTASIAGKTFGQTATATGAVTMRVKVQTPSWFGTSRIEVYRNGYLAASRDLDVPESQIVDFDGDIDVGTPTEDSWYVVVAMGLDDEDFLAPVYMTVALGDLGLDKITSLAFGNLGALASLLDSELSLPDYFPSIPYAMANPIFVDVDGGGYAAPAGPPPFCPVACTPGEKGADGKYPQADCSDGAIEGEKQVCYPNAFVGRSGDGGTCGRDIDGDCGLAFVPPVAENSGAVVSSALTVAPSGGHDDHGPGRPTVPREAPKDEASKNHLKHSIGRYIWNSFVHGFHAHDRH